jgi:sigma-E factor negative regulatory protein RseC
MEQSRISHRGTVVEKNGQTVRVKITRSDACGHCAAQRGCQMLNTTERIIEVPADRQSCNFEVGETVLVHMQTHSGLKAVFYAYLLPILLMMACVSLMYAMHCGEGLIALTAIGSIVLYYLLLYLFRRRINRKFSFKIEKLAE